MNSEKVKQILISISKKINEQKDFLTDLDNQIADGDHGVNLARGFVAVEKMLNTTDSKDIGLILKNTGMKLVSTVGGAAGPLYGTAFLRTANVMNGKEEINMNDFIACLDAAIAGVQFRGKAVKGEKTMLDAMIPAFEEIRNTYKETNDTKIALELGVKAAYDGIEFTKTIAATKGRASYIGERSIGHQDPGATSFTFMLETIFKEMN